jgi:hypothetical protein
VAVVAADEAAEAALEQAGRWARQAGRQVVFVASIRGTPNELQDLAQQAKRLAGGR